MPLARRHLRALPLTVSQGGACRLLRWRIGMKDELSRTYVGIDVSKDKLAAAVADGAPGGEVLFQGPFENAPAPGHARQRTSAASASSYLPSCSATDGSITAPSHGRCGISNGSNARASTIPHLRLRCRKRAKTLEKGHQSGAQAPSGISLTAGSSRAGIRRSVAVEDLLLLPAGMRPAMREGESLSEGQHSRPCDDTASS